MLLDIVDSIRGAEFKCGESTFTGDYYHDGRPIYAFTIKNADNINSNVPGEWINQDIDTMLPIHGNTCWLDIQNSFIISESMGTIAIYDREVQADIDCVYALIEHQHIRTNNPQMAGINDVIDWQIVVRYVEYTD